MYMGYWDNLLFYTRYSTILFQPCRRFSPSPSERITGRIVHFSKLSSRLIVLSGDFCFAGTKKMFVRRYLLYLVSATLPRYETLPESRNKNKKNGRFLYTLWWLFYGIFETVPGTLVRSKLKQTETLRLFWTPVPLRALGRHVGKYNPLETRSSCGNVFDVSNIHYRRLIK